MSSFFLYNISSSSYDNMNSNSFHELEKMKRLKSVYNMIPNLFWSVICLAPIFIFYYKHVELKLLNISVAISLLSILLPNSFFNKIQLSKTAAIYKNLGVRRINRFTQNGEIINGIMRKQFPQLGVVAQKRRAIKSLLKQTYYYEKFHFSMFTFFILTTMYALSKHYFGWTFTLLVTNLIYNVFPNLLQQYVRVRLMQFSK
jgi:hypothetical protein